MERQSFFEIPKALSQKGKAFFSFESGTETISERIGGGHFHLHVRGSNSWICPTIEMIEIENIYMNDQMTET